MKEQAVVLTESQWSDVAKELGIRRAELEGEAMDDTVLILPTAQATAERLKGIIEQVTKQTARPR